jgi:hypothetical protein
MLVEKAYTARYDVGRTRRKSVRPRGFGTGPGSEPRFRLPPNRIDGRRCHPQVCRWVGRSDRAPLQQQFDRSLSCCAASMTASSPHSIVISSDISRKRSRGWWRGRPQPSNGCLWQRRALPPICPRAGATHPDSIAIGRDAYRLHPARSTFSANVVHRNAMCRLTRASGFAHRRQCG